MVTTLSGTIVDEDGTVQATKTVFVYNRTKNEQHSGNEGGDYANLVTDSSGNYSVDLEKFSGGVATNDQVFVSVYDSSTYKKGMARVVVIASATNDCDVTIERLEPHQAIVWFLRSRLTDPQTNRNNAVQMVKTNEPRGQAKLTKNSYPRVSVRHQDEKAERAGATAIEMIRTVTLKIGVHIWAKDGDTQSLEMSDEIDREGQEMRDFLIRDVENALNDRFFVTPSTREPMLQDFTAYRQEGMETPDPEVDEVRGVMKKYLIIVFTYIGG